MARKMVAANWKMNLVESDVAQFFEVFLAGLHSQWFDDLDVVIFPQTLHLALVRERLKDRIEWGAQNIWMQESGAFTGETSPKSLADFGASYVLVGHSERRQLFGEGDDLVAAKIEAAQRNGLKPILCVGETLQERKANETAAVVERQLKAALKKLDKFKGVIAYEPVWAIGTGKNASPEQAQEVHLLIREIAGKDVSILYGGSVKPANAEALMKMPDVDGFLVGGASLNPQDFLSITSRVYDA